uniref:Uncharacterized protein n=1 Tax=Timema shepardi TaxID=629360 RepID=A0A7R9G0K4_TIMSH|nr:unnamed protein product [Timema shepardi]
MRTSNKMRNSYTDYYNGFNRDTQTSLRFVYFPFAEVRKYPSSSSLSSSVFERELWPRVQSRHLAPRTAVSEPRCVAERIRTSSDVSERGVADVPPPSAALLATFLVLSPLAASARPAHNGLPVTVGHFMFNKEHKLVYDSSVLLDIVFSGVAWNVARKSWLLPANQWKGEEMMLENICELDGGRGGGSCETNYRQKCNTGVNYREINELTVDIEDDPFADCRRYIIGGYAEVIRGGGCPFALQTSVAFSPSCTDRSALVSSYRMSGGTDTYTRHDSVDLTHVAASVSLLHLSDMKLPRVVVVVSDADAGVIAWHYLHQQTVAAWLVCLECELA